MNYILAWCHMEIKFDHLSSKCIIFTLSLLLFIHLFCIFCTRKANTLILLPQYKMKHRLINLDYSMSCQEIGVLIAVEQLHLKLAPIFVNCYEQQCFKRFDTKWCSFLLYKLFLLLLSFARNILHHSSSTASLYLNKRMTCDKSEQELRTLRSSAFKFSIVNGLHDLFIIPITISV